MTGKIFYFKKKSLKKIRSKTYFAFKESLNNPKKVFNLINQIKKENPKGFEKLIKQINYEKTRYKKDFFKTQIYNDLLNILNYPNENIIKRFFIKLKKVPDKKEIIKYIFGLLTLLKYNNPYTLKERNSFFKIKRKILYLEKVLSGKQFLSKQKIYDILKKQLELKFDTKITNVFEFLKHTLENEKNELKLVKLESAIDNTIDSFFIIKYNNKHYITTGRYIHLIERFFYNLFKYDSSIKEKLLQILNKRYGIKEIIGIEYMDFKKVDYIFLPNQILIAKDHKNNYIAIPLLFKDKPSKITKNLRKSDPLLYNFKEHIELKNKYPNLNFKKGIFLSLKSENYSIYENNVIYLEDLFKNINFKELFEKSTNYYAMSKGQVYLFLKQIYSELLNKYDEQTATLKMIDLINSKKINIKDYFKWIK